MFNAYTILLYIISKVLNDERDDVLKTLFDKITYLFGKIIIY